MQKVHFEQTKTKHQISMIYVSHMQDLLACPNIPPERPVQLLSKPARNGKSERHLKTLLLATRRLHSWAVHLLLIECHQAAAPCWQCLWD